MIKKQIRTINLRTVEARKKLAPNKEIYWVSVAHGISIGYRKTTKSGSWHVRIYKANGKYHKRRYGLADDIYPADGKQFFSYPQVLKYSIDPNTSIDETVNQKRISRSGYSVDDAIEDYMEYCVIEDKSLRSINSVIEHHIRPTFGKYLISEITKDQIEKWRLKIAEPVQPKGENKSVDNSPEGRRKRKATSNRVLTVLKAILNYAYWNEKCESNRAWAKVRAFRKVDAPKIRYLTISECKRLINSCSPEFRPLVEAALLTGARYGELSNLKASDYNPDTKRLTLYGKSKDYRTIPLNNEGVQFFNNLCAGKLTSDYIFTRSNGAKWGRSQQTRFMLTASKKAELIPPITFHALRHTYASQLIMNGTSIRVVQELLGHSDSRITVRNYAHLAENYVQDVINTNLPTFGIKTSNVSSIS